MGLRGMMITSQQTGGTDASALIERSATDIYNKKAASVGSYAFHNYSALLSVNLPSCKSVGDYAFNLCTNLTTADLQKCTDFGNYAFNDCSKLTSIKATLCENIGECAFMRCSSLTSVDFPNCQSVNQSAFLYCTSLKEVNLPACVSINQPFSGCTSLESIYLPNCKTESGFSFNSCTNLMSADLPVCTSLGAKTFGDCTKLATVNLPMCETLGEDVFHNCTALADISLPACTALGSEAFCNCTSLVTVDLPLCNSFGTYRTFGFCSALQTIDLPNCTSLAGSYIFNSCTSLESINIKLCASIGDYAFYNCTSLTSINLPSCTSLAQYTFRNCTNLKEIHFAAANESTVKALSYYSSKWGATNATIYFDLQVMTLLPSDAKYIVNNKDVDGNVAGFNVDTGNSIVAYKQGYCLTFDSVTPTSIDNFEHTVELATEGISYSLNVDGVADGVEITTTFAYNGITLVSVTGSTPSILVPADTEITYTVKAAGYSAQAGTLQGDADVSQDITLEEIIPVTYNMSYPFTGYDDVLSKLVNVNNNFIVSSAPTVVSGSGIAASIVNGSKSFKVNNGVSYGYIKFHTPATTDSSLLTVFVKCCAYSQSYYDVGFVYIDTALHNVTSSSTRPTATGTNSIYGYVMYTNYGKTSADYLTVSKVLNADTTYYLQFAYVKNSSSNLYWDRLSITNIYFTDAGTY